MDCPATTSTKYPNTTTATTKATTTKAATTTAPVPTTQRLCDGNRVYNACSTPCVPSCQYMNQSCVEATNNSCQPVCQCPEGLVNNGTYCILPGDCPCLDSSGRFWRPGSKWARNCSVCNCFDNKITCLPIMCPTLPYCPAPDYKTVIPLNECCPKCISVGINATTSPIACSGFRCEERCIPSAWACDGERDCIDGNDEVNCVATANCSQSFGKEIYRNRFFCFNIQLVLPTWRNVELIESPLYSAKCGINIVGMNVLAPLTVFSDLNRHLTTCVVLFSVQRVRSQS